ncbi:LysR family transcriptional regulator [Amaricoccus sp. W119]|uniref:LysR family transcriptional regulator n=1 Tax=Amaricoccus sp. W119 TaxID=3391833 RepID=UPI0039A5CA3F
MQKSSVRWDDFRVFLAVARHRRLGAAGRGLGLDPATVGRRVAALEEGLGRQLFDRGRRGYILTEAGRGLVAHAQTMESQISEAVELAGGDPEQLSGVVRVGAPDGVSHYLLIDACDMLSRDNPDLRVECVSLPRSSVLSRREADLAISVSPPTAGRLTVRKIADFDLRLYVRDEILAARPPVDRLEDLADLRGIGYISDMVFERELDYYALLGRNAEPALTSNSLITQRRWCQAGAGLCILPDFMAREHPELTAVLPDEIRLRRSFYLIRHQDDARVARINRVADVIVRRMRLALGDGPA